MSSLQRPLDRPDVLPRPLEPFRAGLAGRGRLHRGAGERPLPQGLLAEQGVARAQPRKPTPCALTCGAMA